MPPSDPRFSDPASLVLTAAGWFPGRTQPDKLVQWRAQLQGSDGFEMFPAAGQVLNEFGGLHIKQTGPGKDHARLSFEFDPMLATGEGELFELWAARLGAKLYPLGEYGSPEYLAVAEDGRVLLLTTPIRLVGSDIDDAIETMVAGRNSSVLDVSTAYPAAAGQTGRYRAYACNEKERRYYVIENEDDHKEVIEVRRLAKDSRILRVEYELLGGRLTDVTARQLIFDKLLVELCEGQYRSEVDGVQYVNALTGKGLAKPYERP
jgi:hypothetical protein